MSRPTLEECILYLQAEADVTISELPECRAHDIFTECVRLLSALPPASTEGPNPGDANTDANMANRVLASGGKPTGESGEGWDCETCEDVQIVESDVPGSPVPHVGECPACAPTEEPEPPTTNEKLTSVKLVVEPSHTVEEECRELGITPPSKQEQLDNISRETGYYPAPEPSPSGGMCGQCGNEREVCADCGKPECGDVQPYCNCGSSKKLAPCPSCSPSGEGGGA